jgi:hypothetical protein
MSSELDSDGRRIDPTAWRRWQLMWRLHFGTPAALALTVWVICIPLAISAVDKLAATRAASHPGAPDAAASAHSPGQTDQAQAQAQSQRVAAASAGVSRVGTGANSALAAALAAGDARLIEALPATPQRSADLGVLISTASDAGLLLAPPDYALENGSLPRLARLRVDLPLRGTAAQLAHFLTLLDAQLPNSLLESLVIQPASPGSPLRVNAHLNLLLFYRTPG